MKPLWIAIEGGDGVGKTTLAQNLTKKYNNPFLTTYNKTEWIPACGGEGCGYDIRQILKKDGLPAFTEECLFAAVLGLMNKQILENAKNGITTITDRSHVSSIVYSTIAKGNPTSWGTLYDTAVDNRVPDIIIHLYSNILKTQQYRATKDKRDDAIDRYDSAGTDFFLRVNYGFDKILGSDKYIHNTIRVCVDGKSIDELTQHVLDLINARRNLWYMQEKEKCLTEATAKAE